MLKRLTEIPEFKNPQHMLRARLLRTILLSLMLAPVIFSISSLMVQPNPARTLVINGSIFVVLIVLFLILKSGHLTIAAIGTLATMVASFTIVAGMHTGVTSPAFTGVILAVLVAGLLLGRSSAFITAGIATLLGIGLMIGSQLNLLPLLLTIKMPALSAFIITTVFSFLAAAFLSLSEKMQLDANRKAKLELEERRNAEARLQMVLEAAHMGTWEIDVPTKTPHFSPQYSALHGREHSDKSLDFIHPEDRAGVRQAIRTVVYGKEDRLLLRYRVVKPDGEVRWHEAWGRVFRNEDGYATRMDGVAYDVTDNVTANEREAERRTLLEKVIELGKAVTAKTDLDSAWREIHHSIQRGLGFDRVGLFSYDNHTRTIRGTYGTDRQGNLEDTHWFTQSVDDYPAWLEVLSNPKGLRVVDNYQETHQHGPESEMYGVRQHVSLAAWVGETPVAVLAVDNGITNRYITPLQIEALQLFAGYVGLAIQNARLNDELEERVRQRTAQLEAVNRELEAFAYSVSHDLRAPLRAVNGYASILTSEYANRLDDNGRDFLAKMRANAERMNNLIDDLLKYSRVGRQDMRPTPVNMDAIVDEVLNDHAEEMKGLPIRIIRSPLPPCVGDAPLLRQVYANLIGNAVKYSRRRADIEITIGSQQQDEQTIYFVRDNGVGFDMKYAGKLFGVFQRLHSEEEFEGTGIGLATVQRIIQRHSGRVWCNAEPDKGATFYFTVGTTPVTESP
ncbi:MAG: ATP-binding protein [Anaerolineales bacterium]